MTVLAGPRASVADAMVTVPRRSPADVTVDGLRALFASPKVHAAVLLDGERLVAVVDRADLEDAPGRPPRRRTAGSGNGSRDRTTTSTGPGSGC